LGIVVLGHVIVTSLLLLLLNCSWNGGFGGGNRPASISGRSQPCWLWASGYRGAGLIRAQGAISADDGDPRTICAVPLSLVTSRSAVAGAMGHKLVSARPDGSAASFIFGRRPCPPQLTLILLAPFVLYHVPYLID
jgi:hypothetical protein